jgi:UDP-N-acetylmuramate dehydrogenase
MIQKQVSLKTYNTFGFDVVAKYFTTVFHVSDLIKLYQNEEMKAERKLILGGGSNLLLLNDWDGLVIKNGILGIEKTFEDQNEVVLKVGGGVVWHQLVMHTVGLNLGGIENLSLIPGTTGAAPMQNIGAYGVEIKDVFVSLEALNIETLETEIFYLNDCKFGYRESVFKHEGKGKFFILNVSFRFQKNPEFKTSYGAIQDTLTESGVTQLSVKAISEAVIAIRKSKLPDPAEIGNSGSFFKNPEIPTAQYNKIALEYPAMPNFPISEGVVKIPAGWLIEQAGWKGKRFGEVGVHDKQALVLVNYGKGKGIEIKQLAEKVQASVFEKFGIEIMPEVNFVS